MIVLIPSSRSLANFNKKGGYKDVYTLLNVLNISSAARHLKRNSKTL